MTNVFAGMKVENKYRMYKGTETPLDSDKLDFQAGEWKRIIILHKSYGFVRKSFPEMQMERQTKAYLYAGLTILFWSTVATAFKIGLRYLDYLELLFFSAFFSLVILVMITAFQGKLGQVRTFDAKQFLQSALLGALNPFLYYIFIFKAYSLLPAQVAQPLNMIWPIVLVFLSVPLLRQKVGLRSYAALLISFAGVYLISSQGKPLSFQVDRPAGILLALGSSLIWSSFWIYNVKDKREEVVKLLLNFFFALLYITAAILMRGPFHRPPVQGVLSCMYIGTFEMGLGFYFWLRALQLARSADSISNLVYLAPFGSLILIHFIVGETIYWTTLLGLILIIVGIIYQKIR